MFTKSLKKLLLVASLSTVFCASTFAANFDSRFFSVDLGQKWKTSGSVHNTDNAVNVNFVDRIDHVSINVMVGSGQIQPQQFLESLAQSLKQQGGNTGPIKKGKAYYYFEFSLQGIAGYAMSSTNGKDVSGITVLGNRKAATDFIRSFKGHDPKLFPTF